MLKNSNTDNWLFQIKLNIIVDYFNFPCLVAYVCIFWSHGLQKNVFFKVHLYILAVAGLEVGTYSNESSV